jgi:phage terminase small subunit
LAQRGRKPKPIVSKVAAGNPGKRSLATLVPAPKDGAMLCPSVVDQNERARGYWQMFLANAAPGHLTPIDSPFLALLCTALARCDEATARIAESGLLVKAPNTGLPMQSPYLPVLNRQTDIARKLAAELALPPAQRNRVGAHGLDDGRPSLWDALES